MRSITFQDSQTIAIGATVQNLLQDSRLVQAPRSGRFTLFMNGSAAGLRVQLIIGSDEVLIDSAVNAFNRFPQTDSDATVIGVPVQAGERITLKVSNPTAGALDVFFRAVLS